MDMEPSVENTENLNVNGTLAVNFAEQMHQQQQTRASSAAESPSHYDDEFGQPSTLSLASPSRSNGGIRKSVCAPSSNDWQGRIDGIKEWSSDTAKYTFQVLSETFGRATKTQDPQLQKQIDSVRDIQRQYQVLLQQMRLLVQQISTVFKTERDMCAIMQDLASKSPELQDDFNHNAQMLHLVYNNGEVLLSALNAVVSSLDTLCNKTVEDTLLTVKEYEKARLEYDVSRLDLERANSAPRSDQASIAVAKAEQKFNLRREKLENLRQVLAVKIKLLEDNKVRVMQKQLMLFHNVTAAYFSGDRAALESTLKEFGIKLPNSVNSTPQPS